MMLSFSNPIALLLVASASVAFAQDNCGTTWKCHPLAAGATPPDLDADLSDWSDVDAFTSSLTMISGTGYDGGDVTLKCQYDGDNVYFAFEIPGEYRFNATNNHLCAAIGTMIKIGEKATYVNMGGCPDALAGCSGGVPDTCDEYRVDIGAHWELKDTIAGQKYDVANSVADKQGGASGTGDDPIANKDDEYAVSPFCRFDDDDSNADNEWAGAWTHTSGVEGEFGNWQFEMSRRLKTASVVTDAQMSAGETIQFGVAFWDPNESDDGWSDVGHYVTGCATNWIDLELVAEDGASGSSSTGTDASAGTDTGAGPDAGAGITGEAQQASAGNMKGVAALMVAVQAVVLLSRFL